MIDKEALGAEMAHVLSEWLNDEAPLREGRYVAPAQAVAPLVLKAVKAEIVVLLRMGRKVSPLAILPADMAPQDAYALGVATLAGTVEQLLDHIEEGLR